MNISLTSLSARRRFQYASPPKTSGSSDHGLDTVSLSDSTDGKELPAFDIRWKSVTVAGLSAVAMMTGSAHSSASVDHSTLHDLSNLVASEKITDGLIPEQEFELGNESVPEIEAEYSFGQRLDGEQKRAVEKMVGDLDARGFDVEADDIINFMATETGGTFDPAIRAGGQRNGAVGLAQFTQTAIDQMNLSRESHEQLSKEGLAEMTFTEQSEVVTEYLASTLEVRGMQGRQVDASDLYSAVFAPVAVGKPETAVIYSRANSNRYYRANRSLDTNHDGAISKSELTSRLDVWAEMGDTLRG